MLNIRKLGVIGRTYRNLNRYSHILAILLKYGFDDLIERLNIERYIDTALQTVINRPRPRMEKLSRAERVRLVLEDLGPTCIKLGQILSTRPDLIPVDFMEEFQKLQDNVPPHPFEDIKAIVENALSNPLPYIFASFDPEPLASASIGQVHRAYLKDGTEVAVKIQRPGIRKTIEVDLEIMFHIADLMERHVEDAKIYHPRKIVEEFARVLSREIDYTFEAATMMRFAAQFADDPTVRVPGVFPDISTEQMLVMEFVRGIKISDIAAIERAGLDRKEITRRGANLFLRQIFDFGFFHADPHPGNIFVMPGNVVCLLDFGMVGSVDRSTREHFVDLIFAVVHQDTQKTCQILLRMTDSDNGPDLRQLEGDLSEFMGQHLFKPLKEIELGRLLQDLLEIASRHRLKIPPNLFLLMKAFVAIEGIGLLLDPDFDMVECMTPFIEQVKMAKLHPQRIADDIMRISGDLIDGLQQFPRDMLDIATMIRRQKLSVKLEHQGMDQLMATYDRLGNKISLSLIIAALLIGSALLVVSSIPPLFYGISLIGIIVFIAATVMGLWLMIAILRKSGL